MKDLRYFIRHCTFWDEDIPHTHTFFGSKIKKLSIPEQSREEFYKAYIDYVSQTPDDVLSHHSGFNTITEKVGNQMQFFVDVDLKLDHIRKNLISIDDVPELMKVTKEAFLEVLNDAFGQSFECLSAFRMLYKCHLHFPGVFVSATQAKNICDDVNLRLKNRYPWIVEKDNGIIDTSVYKTGLRMLYSHKGSMAKEKDVDEHVAFFGEEMPYGYYYRLGDIIDGELVYKDEPLTLDMLRSTSIHSESEDILPFVEKYRVILSTKSKGKNVAIKSSEKHDLQHNSQQDAHHDGNSTDSMETDRVDTVNELEKVPSTVAFLVREYLDEVISEMGLDPTVSEMKINQYGSVLVILAPQTCPIAMRKHKRTAERNVSTTYVVLNAFECTLRCFDEECSDAITLKYPQDALAKELRHHTKHYVLKRSLYKQTNETVAEYIFSIIHETHAASAASGSSYLYYHFEPKEHRWIQQESVMMTIMSENGEVQKSYNAYINEVMADAGIADNDKKRLKGLWLDLENQLQTTAFVRGGVLPILARKLEDYWMHVIKKIRKGKMMSFQSMLDDNPTLMGFTNGVWDFRNYKFRDGKPTDFISMSTNLPYTPFEKMPQDIVEEMFTALRKIYVKEDHFNYIMSEIASCLNGTPNQQRFFLMTGRGANGKSTLVRLLNLSFGDYSGEVNITLFTKPRPPANAPCPELIAIKGQRFVSCSEPNARDPFNLGTIKWLTGGDRITAAQKFEKNQSFYLQCTFFSLINDIPPINATINDHGTWRRMKPVEHFSRFVEEPDPENPLEFKMDNELNDAMERWNEAFISYLIHVFLSRKTYKIPQEFKDLFHKLQGNNDPYSRFVQEMVIRDEGEFKEGLAVFTAFNEWKNAMKLSKRDVPYDHFEKHMMLLIGKFVEDDEGRQGWNISLKPLPSSYF